MHTPYSTARPAAPHRERGIALFVVIVFVMLSMLLALWASRTAIFNEMVVGNDADYQRAFEAAQSLIQDAELDIRRWNDTKNFPDHRPDDKTALDALFQEDKFYDFADSRNTAPFCKNGLCAKRRGKQDFWNNKRPNGASDPEPKNPEVFFDQLTAEGIGARYGQFTDAKKPKDDDSLAPLLRDGRYWIEVLKYKDSGSLGGPGLIVEDDPNAAPTAALLDLRLPKEEPKVVYRITAWASGLKPGSTAVIQETYALTRDQLDFPQ